MSQLEPADHALADDDTAPAYVPPLQYTVGQPEPIAANGGRSYMAFDRDGDAGTSKALDDALTLIAEGSGHRVAEEIARATPNGLETKWGLGFRTYEECLNHMRKTGAQAPEGGLALPLPYTIYEQPTYSIVPSHGVWKDPARADIAAVLQQNEEDNRRRDLWFPQVMRDARRIGDYYPGLSPDSPGEHGPARGLAGAPTVAMHELLRRGRGGARLLSRNREAAPGLLPGCDRCARL